MPTYDRVHLASCLADAVRSAIENLRDDPAVSLLTFHHVIKGSGTYHGDNLYSLAYGYLEEGLVRCTCGAIPNFFLRRTKRDEPQVVEAITPEEEHECEVTRADLDDLRREMEDKIESIERLVDEFRNNMNDDFQQLRSDLT